MALLSRDSILGADDLRSEEVEVKEWGGAVKVRCLTGAERDEFEGFVLQAKDRGYRNLRAKLVSLAAVGPDGKRLFAAADLEVLGDKSGAVLDRLYSTARRLSGFDDADLKELEGNSPPAPSGGSGSS